MNRILSATPTEEKEIHITQDKICFLILLQKTKIDLASSIDNLLTNPLHEKSFFPSASSLQMSPLVKTAVVARA